MGFIPLNMSLIIISKNNKNQFKVSNYPLESVALVNVKRAPAIAISNIAGTADPSELNLIQLLVFPEQLYFRCESGRVKREWLDSVEDAKKKQQEEKAMVRQATIRGYYHYLFIFLK